MIRALIHCLFSNVLIFRVPPNQTMDGPNKMFHAMFHVLVEWVEVDQPFTDPALKTFKRRTCIPTLFAEVFAAFDTPDNEDFLPIMIELVELYRWYKSEVWNIANVQFTDIQAYSTAEADIEQKTTRLLELREYIV